MTLRRYLDPEIQAVGVFVNELPAIVAGYLEEGVIDLAQLHGNESEEYIHSLRFRTGGELIKAFSIKTREDVEKAKKSSADYILLDHGKGGTGESFDWSLIRNMDRPYFLAGEPERRKMWNRRFYRHIPSPSTSAAVSRQTA